MPGAIRSRTNNLQLIDPRANVCYQRPQTSTVHSQSQFMFDLAKAADLKAATTLTGQTVPDVQMFQEDIQSKETLENITPEQQQQQKRPLRANRSLTNKEVFKENSHNFRAKYEDMPLKRPPKYRAPLPKP